MLLFSLSRIDFLRWGATCMPIWRFVMEWRLCEYVIVHTILPPSLVTLWISLGGKPKWLPLNFGYHVMRTGPIRQWQIWAVFVLFYRTLVFSVLIYRGRHHYNGNFRRSHLQDRTFLSKKWKRRRAAAVHRNWQSLHMHVHPHSSTHMCAHFHTSR